MITPELITQVGAAVEQNPAAAALRPQFPDIHFTECSADDVNARFTPVLETPLYELYLISGASGHCLEVTADYNSATGVIVAAKSDD